MRTAIRGAFAAIVLGATGASALAADLGYKAPPPPPPPPVFVDTFHPFQIRVGVAGAIPIDGTAKITDRGGPGATYLNALIPGAPPLTVLQTIGLSNGAGSTFGANTTISWSVIPKLEVSYFVTKNWALSTICCISNQHVQGTGVIAGASVINTKVFPPTLLLQYHFTNFGAFQPYVGIGVNYTTFWATRAGNATFPFFAPGNPGLGLPPGQYGFNTAYSASITPSWGVVGQVGANYMFNDKWGVYADVKYIMMEPNAHVWLVNHNSFNGAFGPLYVPVNLAVKINPIVAGVGVTYRFGGAAPAPVLAKY